VAQGTIKDYDDETKIGSVLTEARQEIAIEPGSVGDAAIRTLRIGQRVKFDVDETSGHAVAKDLRIVTFD
jgi:cold shock CspA family protein